MRRHISLGPLYACWGRLESHNHFAMPGKPWTSPWKPSQDHPVKWQIVRGVGTGARKLLVWILWIYPEDGTAIHIEVGWSRTFIETMRRRFIITGE